MRYKLNVLGPFYVEHECCLMCGVPWENAPELFDYDDTSCWVKKQPATEAELEHMIAVMRMQEARCIRYAGSAPDVIRRLRAVGEGEQCDQLSDPDPPRRVSFAASDSTVLPLLESLQRYVGVRYWMTSLSTPVSDARGTLRLARPSERARTIELELQPDGRWLLHHDGDVPLTDTVHRWLAAFGRDIRWQTKRGEQPEPW